MDRSTDELREITRFADELPVAIWVGRVPSGECVYVNAAFRQILGIDPPENAARGNYVGPYSVHTLDGSPYPEAEMPYERAVRARAPIEVDDMFILRHDGGRTYLRVYARPLVDSSGTITHIVEAFTDISREVESTHAWREREAQLRQAQRMESLGSLAGGIAHDFNNLLTIIKMIASNAAMEEVSPELEDALKRIDDVTESAAMLTRALLGFARQGKNLQRPVSVTAVATGVADLARRTVGRQITVVTDLAPDPLEVQGDPGQLEQLLMNLVVNARDAIEGQGVLTVRAVECQISGDGDLPPGRYARVEVEDTGTGIPDPIRDRIFEPYFTTKNHGAHKGTGLGLATVFGIVESHRGRVSVARTGPGGTVMRVMLPLSDGDGAEPAPEPRPEAAGPARGTILVVDDEALVLDVVARSLRALGYRVHAASGGAEAVELFRSNPVDAVVLDLVMPDMGGRETYLALKAMNPDIRVLLITGYAFNNRAQELLDLGVAGLLPKPFSIAELAAALGAVLKG